MVPLPKILYRWFNSGATQIHHIHSWRKRNEKGKR